MIMMIDDDYKHKQITVTLSVTWWLVKLDLHKKHLQLLTEDGQ